ncbi:FAD-dependent oxidoreductase, partial [Actinomyces bowdenii]|nr:FAD-dependent oxidoreductase [Actinomyces bowdenii]NYS70548.1 FAD-dependent oxidoreductase [Actinomyces bowdenii]
MTTQATQPTGAASPSTGSPGASADVIVVGAGPAGCSAARHLATAGLDVLLLEKNELGRDKVCGDGLTPSAVRELVRLGMDTTGWQRNSGLRVIGGGHRLHFPWPEQASLPSYGLARPRALLDRDLAEHAAAAGARLLTGVTVTAPRTSRTGRITGVEAKPTPRVAYPGI